MRLYRPVGLKELRLIAAAQFRAFPPRLSWQPIFYPVLSFDYAERIVLLWNVNEEAAEYSGFVTRFDLDDSFAQRYEPHAAAGQDCQELWVPSEELDAFNAHLVGLIHIDAAHYGPQFQGELDAQTNWPADIARAWAACKPLS